MSSTSLLPLFSFVLSPPPASVLFSLPESFFDRALPFFLTMALIRQTQRSLIASHSHQFQQKATLVNVKIKWVKDRSLDSIVTRERLLRPAHHLISLLSSSPISPFPSNQLSKLSSKFGLSVFTFLNRYPTLFIKHKDGYSLTKSALELREREIEVLRDNEKDLVERLQRLLMICVDQSVPLHTIDLLSWDLGLPKDYRVSLIPKFQHIFELFQPDKDERVWLRLVKWENRLAISELEKKNSSLSQSSNLGFPLGFPRGFGPNKKVLTWLTEFQALPYTSPYSNPSSLDPRTDISEKRNVAIFHELLHLTVAKKTERRNVSNMRKLLQMPQKFTKVFERHPWIFYLSEKLGTQTVVLREAYEDEKRLVNRNPIVGIREEYSALMRAALPIRVRKERKCENGEEKEGEDLQEAQQ
ncbi:hypothetical protein LUZ60_015817 [Juncus effusus]|nr:hypothetical protein LUZ60_015817 [Juncus effusus]